MVFKPRKCYYLRINKNIANESIELGNKVVHAKAVHKLPRYNNRHGFKLSKPYTVNYKNNYSKVKCFYQS